MRYRWRVLLLGLVMGAIVFASGGPAGAASSSEWQSSPSFRFDSAELPGLASGASKAFYRLYDPQGAAIGNWIEPPSYYVSVLVPQTPGVYSFEGWLEDAAGNELSRRTALLHFDNAVPPPPNPRAPEGWLPGDKPVFLPLDPPSEPLPISGIGAYELTLEESGARFSTSGESISLGFLPEGLNRAEVVAVSGSGVRSAPRDVTFAIDATPPASLSKGCPAAGATARSS